MTILLRATFPNALRSGRPARTETRGAAAAPRDARASTARRFALLRCPDGARACPPTAPDVDARRYFN
jgi:hypothetical protein